MNRIVIFGNSGSGKTWLASKLSDSAKVCYSLDDFFWVPGGYSQKRSPKEVLKEIQAVKNKYQWIVEGVFGHLLVELVVLADVVIFLDISWCECKKALMSRGSESSKQLDKTTAEKNFQDLLKWASSYSDRDTTASRAFHESLYNKLDKVKYKLSKREEIDAFVKQCKC